YDSMIAKLIVNAKTRSAAMMRLRRALDEFVIMGIDTTIPLLQDVIAQQEFIDGTYDIHWLENFMKTRG
ncbi:MAG: acetyl-CoA carboxylase biotin carboxylase subunit, partial [Alphaproteobacteria bacterium]|nr:acetyl-CoA carboxylase biotin carboxylase subunit [Alphaproteobacteria bacterium]